MSAERSSRSVSHAEGVDKVRAFQRVLYRAAKQDPARRFHAVYHHVARSDILWRAWSDVRANRGPPGVDGLSIDAVEESGWRSSSDNYHVALSLALAEAGPDPEVAIGAAYGWYWAVDLLQAEGANVHLVHPSGCTGATGG